jgi:CMP-2-keto-3-deoxyoctulosonic acid synthetase
MSNKFPAMGAKVFLHQINIILQIDIFDFRLDAIKKVLLFERTFILNFLKELPVILAFNILHHFCLYNTAKGLLQQFEHYSPINLANKG